MCHRHDRPGTITSLVCALLLCPAAAQAARIDAQRAAFREVYPRAELGDWEAVRPRAALLADYVLWPDLRAAYLRARLTSVDAGEVRRFIEHYQTLKPARELRYRFALELAAAGRAAEFLELYDRHYRALGVATLDCLALDALRGTATVTTLLEHARPLWLVGHSQADTCDPAFSYLRRQGALDEALYAERFALAIEARSLSLARYLARSLPEEYRHEAARWTRVYGEPRRFLRESRSAEDSAALREKQLAALETLAYDEPATAAAAWDALEATRAFTAPQRYRIERHVALWLARNHDAGAAARLAGLPPAAVDTEVLRWRVRVALVNRDWQAVPTLLDALPPAEADTEQWRYWRAMAWQQTGSTAAARTLLADIAGERSYYGFLAADALGSDYAFSHEPLRADEAIVAALAQKPELIRARELFLVDLEGRGRSEWDTAVRQLAPPVQLQAAVLAHRWGWHSRAIATAADLDRYDDLELRYPLPYAEAFELYSAAAGIRPSWAYGVARSESLFMRDIRSPAGAIGVMQLTPATGRRTASQLSEPYAGRRTLLDPVRNIRLGTSYLAQMFERFDRNPVLATAAYNAGPQRVEAWLPDAGSIDARIWVETIPYQETRDYVRRVLAADTIFHWRLAGDMRRLSSALHSVAARPVVAHTAPR
ncbi:MAG TPA: transglycosylase SLT domain-containing protein [Woeseiaceae bacterium]|nr:transglycosylase SLT domain-containing protein [Woeseiaceae bacterium]